MAANPSGIAATAKLTPSKNISVKSFPLIIPNIVTKAHIAKHNTSKIFPNPSNLSLRGDFSSSMSCNISAIDPIFVLIPIAVTLNLPLPFNTLVPM